MGLKADFKSIQGHPNSDGLLNWLTGLLRERLGVNALSHVKVGFESIEDEAICRVDVSPSPEPVHVDSKDFFVRLHNTTQQLGYGQRRWAN